jgi:hypothetical protein
MPQSRYRSGGFTPPFSGWRGKPAATFDTETEALRAKGDWGAWNQIRDSESVGSELTIATGQGREEPEVLDRCRQRQEVEGGGDFVSGSRKARKLLTGQL